MVFKDKNDLIVSVKDYSIRVVRREYSVLESTRICGNYDAITMLLLSDVVGIFEFLSNQRQVIEN